MKDFNAGILFHCHIISSRIISSAESNTQRRVRHAHNKAYPRPKAHTQPARFNVRTAHPTCCLPAGQKLCFLMTALFLLLTLLSGCATHSPPTTFYELRALPPAVKPDRQQTPAATTVLAVGPVTVSGLLDQPQLVSAAANNVLQIAEYHRWGGSLAANAARVMASNLASRATGYQVFALPWPIDLAVDYRLALNINRLYAVPDAASLLDADWTLLNGAGQALTPVRNVVLREATNMQGYPGLVGAFDRLLAKLADSVAATLQRNGIDAETVRNR